MDKEIEVKLSYNNKIDVISKIKSLGAKKKENITLIDKYFGLGHSDMSNKNNITRIRTKKNHSELTFKGNTKNINNIWERTELTVSVDNPDTMEKILLSLGFNYIMTNKSNREIWTLEGTSIEFIDFVLPKEMHLIEIEAKHEKIINNIVEKLGNLVERVGEESFQKFDKTRKVK